MIPEILREALERYVIERIEPGGFLMACLENNLREACARADGYNRHRIWEIVDFMYNGIPSDCWGSPEKVKEWLAGRPA